jgi:hypothetical protein
MIIKAVKKPHVPIKKRERVNNIDQRLGSFITFLSSIKHAHFKICVKWVIIEIALKKMKKQQSS